MNLQSATQAANAIDLTIRSGGVQAALANIDLLLDIYKAVEAEKAKTAAPIVEPKPEPGA